MEGLTYKQARFVEEYTADPSNATAAARRAGYSTQSAKQMAQELLNHPKIKQALGDITDNAVKRLGITKERILQELAALAFSDLKHVISEDEDGNTTVNVRGLQDKDSSPLTELKITHKKGKKDVSIKLADKRAALIDLARMMGWDKQQVEVTGKLSLEKLIEASFTELPQPEPLLIEDDSTTRN